ncbi:MAG: 2Fe-2S iron-sulfur cluster-binding protein [Myxococcota bacterium]
MPRIKPLESPVTIELDGEQLPARAGEPVAVALIAHGEQIFARSPKYHRPRGPYCLDGGCSQCLMRVDGVPNVATCRTAVKPGMRLERQNAMPDGRLDLLRANDFIFRDWFNHHEFLAGVPLAEAVLLKVARQLSGLGVLPEREAPAREPAAIEHVKTVLVGAGVAGSAAAQELRRRGVDFVHFERDASSAARRGEVVGLFADDGRPFLAVVEAERLHLVFYEQALLAMGAHAMLPTFPNNDLPGVMAGRAVATLIREHGVLPGARIACVGDAEEAKALAALVGEAGGEALAVGEEVVRAHGLRAVDAITTRPGGKTSCDVIACCGVASPSFELARAAGAPVRWHPGHRCFVVEADAAGRTAVPGLFVAGEMCGPMSPAAAVEQGTAAAAALAEVRS